MILFSYFLLYQKNELKAIALMSLVTLKGIQAVRIEFFCLYYKIYVFYSDMKFKMAATAGLSLTLDPMGKMFQNASSLKPLAQLKPNFPGMIIGRSSTRCVFFMPIGNPRWPPPQDID